MNSIQSPVKQGSMEHFCHSFATQLSGFTKTLRENVPYASVGGALIATKDFIFEQPSIYSAIGFSMGALAGYGASYELNHYDWKDLNTYLSSCGISPKYRPLVGALVAAGAMGACASFFFNPVSATSLGYGLIGVGVHAAIQKATQTLNLSKETHSLLEKVNAVVTGSFVLQAPLRAVAFNLMGGVIGAGFYSFEHSPFIRGSSKKSS